MSRVMRLACGLVWIVALVVVALPCAAYVWVAETWTSRVLACACLTWLAVPGLWRRRGARAATLGLVLGACLFAIGGWALPPTPPATGVVRVDERSFVAGAPARAPARVYSLFSGGFPYPHYAVPNLVPEIDQVKFGTYLAPWADPLIRTDDARVLREVTMNVYRDMQCDSAFERLGSAMTYAYSDIDSGHLYAYVPARRLGERLKVLLFLHGSGGNFKVYTHLLVRVADAERAIVVAPSFGFGNWNEAGGVAAVARARAFALDTLGGDPSNVVLMGLSNGGRGVTRAWREAGASYAGFILVSAVIEPAVLSDSAWLAQAAGKSVLVVYGDADDRIPESHTREAVQSLRAAGAQVQERIYPGENHFLYFAKKEAVLTDVATYLRAVTLAD